MSFLTCSKNIDSMSQKSRINDRELEFTNTVKVESEMPCMVDCALTKCEEDNLSVHCGDCAVGVVSKVCKDADVPFVYKDWIGGVKYKVDSSDKRVILVLESPHKDEFKIEDGELIRVGPAAGKTGTYIRKYLPLIFSGMEDFGSRKLILVNAIQFRCSLGRSLWGKENANGMKFKNRVLTELLNKEMFAEDLKRRLKLVWRNADMDMVVNCSTLNGAIGCLVGKIIKCVTGRCVCGIGHPSRWFSTWKTARTAASHLYQFTK